MGITAKIVKKGNTTDKMRKNLIALNKENVKIGYFAEQGKHPSGMTFAELMALQEFGTEDIPKRPVFQITAFTKAPNKSRAVNGAVRNWTRDLAGPANTRTLLNQIGRYYQKELKGLFGDGSALTPNSPLTIRIKGRDEPLVDSGELRDNLAYKNSIDEKIQK